MFGKALAGKGYGRDPRTEILRRAGVLLFAEDYHQQYLAKNPSGYLRASAATGVAVSDWHRR